MSCPACGGQLGLLGTLGSVTHFRCESCGADSYKREALPCQGRDRNGCNETDETGAEERYSLGIYAGRWCDRCWKTSGYRDEPASAFDPLDAGEHYEAEDY